MSDVILEIVDLPASVRLSRDREAIARRIFDERVRLRRRLPGVGDPEWWHAVRDDAGATGPERSRMALIFPVEDSDSLDIVAAERPHQRMGEGIEVWVYAARFVSDRAAPGRSPRHCARGLRIAAMNCDRGHEHDFHTWYEEDHLPAFTDLEGILAGVRYEAQRAPRRYLALYWLDDIARVDTPEWKTAADTDWTRRIRPFTRDRDRLVLERYEPSGW